MSKLKRKADVTAERPAGVPEGAKKIEIQTGNIDFLTVKLLSDILVELRKLNEGIANG